MIHISHFSFPEPNLPVTNPFHAINHNAFCLGLYVVVRFSCLPLFFLQRGISEKSHVFYSLLFVHLLQSRIPLPLFDQLKF